LLGGGWVLQGTLADSYLPTVTRIGEGGTDYLFMADFERRCPCDSRRFADIQTAGLVARELLQLYLTV
jgi:hypothetical protein